MSDTGAGPYCSDGNHCSQRERIAELEKDKLELAQISAGLYEAVENLEEALRRLVDSAEHVERTWLVQGQEWDSVTDAKRVLQEGKL